MPSPYTTANLRPDFLPGVRLPVRSSLSKIIGLMPYWVDMFNEILNAQQSDENRFTMTEDFWWVATVASVTSTVNEAIAHPAFAFQLYELDQSGNVSTDNQQKPVNAENFFGTPQHPFYLTKPLFFPSGTQLLCRAQSLQTGQGNNGQAAFQVVMMGYMR